MACSPLKTGKNDQNNTAGLVCEKHMPLQPVHMAEYALYGLTSGSVIFDVVQMTKTVRNMMMA